MWFEILPTFAIIVASVAAPHGLAYILNYFVLGNCYRRLMQTEDHRLKYLRDRRLTCDPYKVSGLENIPDDPCEAEDAEKNRKTEDCKQNEQTVSEEEQSSMNEECTDFEEECRLDDESSATEREC